MNQLGINKKTLKYLSPENLHAQLAQFTKGMAVTKGSFDLLIDQCTLEDIEWNHMDQMHRPTIHNTYEKGVRIATGEDFAVSLTQWKKWPLLITVTDVYVDKGLFYQSLTLAGVIFVHSIISMKQVGNRVELKDEWYITSHKLFKFMHGFLNKMLYKLNVRLQEEDEQIRQGRFALRKKGYCFKTDVPNYYNSNQLGTNTIYPALVESANFSLEDVSDKPVLKLAGNIEFIVKKTERDTYLMWPAVCPHEGGPLLNGSFCDAKVTCPWHGLHFKAVELSEQNPAGSVYGFQYELVGKKVYVRQVSSLLSEPRPLGSGTPERCMSHESGAPLPDGRGSD